jgi:hypothetical protein
MSTITPQIRALPLYVYAMREGEDVGLVIAMTAICSEMGRQGDAAVAAALDPTKPDARLHEYASARLLEIGQIVAARFRQGTP